MSARSLSFPRPAAKPGTASPRRTTRVVTIFEGIQRRWQRERRRRAVGRAYDMAREIAQVVPRQSRVLDVGCGNGLIAHHLSALLGTGVVGTDLMLATSAPIEYRSFDGIRLPATENEFDAVSLCYVLHHVQKLKLLLSELRRVLKRDGLVVVYEDIPESWWDRAVCFSHNLQWRKRTGRCTFRLPSQWRHLFEAAGFRVLSERPLSRWRNLTHPVRRRFYLLTLKHAEFVSQDLVA